MTTFSNEQLRQTMREFHHAMGQRDVMLNVSAREAALKAVTHVYWNSPVQAPDMATLFEAALLEYSRRCVLCDRYTAPEES